MASKELPKICIIGAGPSGFTLAKRLKDNGIPYDEFDLSDDIGGNWYYRNPNGMSACYKSLHIDTSKNHFSFEDLAVPKEWPAYPHQSQMLSYFHEYVTRFDLRKNITFNTGVAAAVRAKDGIWDITLTTGERRRYDALAVCNGHHWSPRMPDFPGSFNGEVIHSHKYNDPFDPINMLGKTVLVVGMGNSAVDIAAELASKPLAKHVFVSARRPVWILPKYVGGKPIGEALTVSWAPPWLAGWLAVRKMREHMGSMEDYNLPGPKDGMFQSHGTLSTEFLMRAGSGDLTAKPNIERLEGDKVRFVDGSTESIDVIVYATGYNVSFPFFSDPDLKADANNHFSLFKRIFRQGWDNLFFLGLAQSRPTLVNLAEQQSKLVIAYLTGRYSLPPPKEMRELTAAEENFYSGRYYKSPRHAMQVEFAHYVAEMNKELVRGVKRAKASGEVPPILAKVGRERQEVAA